MNPIEKYFRAEKAESLLFMILGLLAIAFAFYFYFKQKESYYIGMSYPLLGIALIQLVVGYTVYKRSPLDETRVKSMMESHIDKIETEEIPRMDVVMKNFVVYRWVEIALAFLGLLLYFFFNQNDMIKGIGVGLSVQSLLMLLLDFFAEKRGHTYLHFLKELILKS